MINEIYKTAVVARKYFELKGEKIANKEASNRFRSIRRPDKNILARIFAEAYAKQIETLK
jgi:hypothetical protein